VKTDSKKHSFIAAPGLQIYKNDKAFYLELGGVLTELQLAYHSYGILNAEKDNVIWVCHALSANSDVADWWPGMVGPGCLMDTNKYFIVCANVLGSNYGSTSPRFINPETNEAYGMNFPRITVRDIANAHLLLMKHLGIDRIEMLIGGSFGGHQAMEMALMIPQTKVKHLVLLATSARETAWSIAIHETQRMALETDETLYNNEEKAGAKGLKTARAIGLLTYRTVDAYITTQSDDDGRTENFKAASYVRYQGEKLEKRFHAHCYWHLSKCLDTHHIGRGRGEITEVLASLDIQTTIIALSSDTLIPPSEQEFLARYIPNAQYFEINSIYGHDGFLIEVDGISKILSVK
jgi:homoserine O-acetyltransferase/O-succinyltransferase